MNVMHLWITLLLPHDILETMNSSNRIFWGQNIKTKIGPLCLLLSLRWDMIYSDNTAPHRWRSCFTILILNCWIILIFLFFSFWAIKDYNTLQGCFSFIIIFYCLSCPVCLFFQRLKTIVWQRNSWTKIFSI